MRPTPHELFCNPEVFTKLLEEQGMEDAQPRVAGLFRMMRSHWQICQWLASNREDLLRNQQAPHRFPRTFQSEAKRRREAVRRVRKIAGMVKNDLVLGQRARAILARVERSISRWPDLPQPSGLRTRPPLSLIQRRGRRLASGRRR